VNPCFPHLAEHAFFLNCLQTPIIKPKDSLFPSTPDIIPLTSTTTMCTISSQNDDLISTPLMFETNLKEKKSSTTKSKPSFK